MHNNNISGYRDIIDLPHRVSETRMPMTIHARAAQFAPFAALMGYEDAIDETARLTEERLELSEDRQAKTDSSEKVIAQREGSTCFCPTVCI